MREAEAQVGGHIVRHHRIEIRNGAFPGYQSEVDIKAGSSASVSYSFKAP